MALDTFNIVKWVDLLHIIGIDKSYVLYTVPGKKRPPKHVQTTLWIENNSHYFSLYHEKPSICNVCVKFHDNQSVHCWDIAFYKKMVENAVANIAN